MKLLLADYWHASTMRLHNNLKLAEINHQTIVMQYDGRLPEKIYNPFTYYTGWHNKKGNGRYFNELELPPFYEVRHKNNVEATIYSGDFEAGRIIYFENSDRLVKQVDWLDRKGRKLMSDVYAIQGHKYGIFQYDTEGKIVKRLYLNKEGQEVIVWDIVTGLITLSLDGKREEFQGLVDFTLYFIQHVRKKRPIDALYINSLSFPLFVANRLESIPAVLFWQEKIGEALPGNMLTLLKEKKAVQKIVFESMSELKKVTSLYRDQTYVELLYLSPLETFKRSHSCSHKALMVTKSDEIHYVREIVTALPNLSLTIADPTEMSAKLQNLNDEFSNVSLVPAANKTRISELLLDHDIYLNIHEGQEVQDIIFRAYQQNYFLLGLSKLAKNERYEWLVKEEAEIIEILTSIMQDKQQEEAWLTRLHQKNGPSSTVVDYRNAL